MLVWRLTFEKGIVLWVVVYVGNSELCFLILCGRDIFHFLLKCHSLSLLLLNIMVYTHK